MYCIVRLRIIGVGLVVWSKFVYLRSWSLLGLFELKENASKNWQHLPRTLKKENASKKCVFSQKKLKILEPKLPKYFELLDTRLSQEIF